MGGWADWIDFFFIVIDMKHVPVCYQANKTKLHFLYQSKLTRIADAPPKKNTERWTHFFSTLRHYAALRN